MIDYKLETLYKNDADSFYAYLQGFLIDAIPEFYGCKNNLDYNLETEEFNSNLTYQEKIVVYLTYDEYEINSEYLKLNCLYNQLIKKKVNFSNLGVLFSYLRSGAFARIFNRLAKPNASKKKFVRKDYINYPPVKVAVYTCIWGNYDSILEPLFLNPNIDYYILTDQEIPEGSAWKRAPIPDGVELKGKTNTEINRFFKMLPHLVFPEYDYSIYIDGNIRIVTDLFPLICDMGEYDIGIHDYSDDCIYEMKNAIIAGKRAKRKDVIAQIKKYKQEGFPPHFGAFECNVLVRKHGTDFCKKIMNEWYEEFNRTTSKRDQLSLPYVLWKNGKTRDCIYSLGHHVRENPRFQVLKKHRGK